MEEGKEKPKTFDDMIKFKYGSNVPNLVQEYGDIKLENQVSCVFIGGTGAGKSSTILGLIRLLGDNLTQIPRNEGHNTATYLNRKISWANNVFIDTPGLNNCILHHDPIEIEERVNMVLSDNIGNFPSALKRMQLAGLIGNDHQQFLQLIPQNIHVVCFVINPIHTRCEQHVEAIITIANAIRVNRNDFISLFIITHKDCAKDSVISAIESNIKATVNINSVILKVANDKEYNDISMVPKTKNDLLEVLRQIQHLSAVNFHCIHQNKNEPPLIKPPVYKYIKPIQEAKEEEEKPLNNLEKASILGNAVMALAIIAMYWRRK